MSVDLLIKAISGQNPHSPSLYDHAKDYFKNAEKNATKLKLISDQIDKLYNRSEYFVKANAKNHSLQIEKLKNDLNQERIRQQACRLDRLNKAITICMHILSLSEGDNYEQTQYKSGKFLTTIALFSPGEGKQLAEIHQTLKPAYKTVLSLRMLDKLMLDGTIQNPYILKEYDVKQRYVPEAANHICYTQAVLMPIMLAAIFQDIGFQHPKLATILAGEEDDKDRFRLLNKDERQQMLDMNYQYTIDYLKHGLGCQLSPIAEKQQASAFSEAEQERLDFQISLVEGANFSKLGTSEIIKIPQKYSSVIFSTKENFSKKSWTNASILVAQLAVKKQISSQLAKVFVSIVGQFPLGYGIVYIPNDVFGNEIEQYEYAIVTELNPKQSEQPICLPVSKNLVFTEFCINEEIEKDRNMHFHKARKKLENRSQKPVSEISQKLEHAFIPEHIDEPPPFYWEPHKYFCVLGNQNLWNIKA